jgi:hypothetical protein
MSLFREVDIDGLESHIDEIVKKADEQRYIKVKPTRSEMWDIIYTVRDYVIKKKRKIYGGFALNKLIESKDPNDKFYDDDNIESWDIDFYSPDPINDAVEIANILYDKGYRFVSAGEAQHEETYTVFAETIPCADISYVPRNIYNKMPFKEINGLYLTGPHFMMIDYFRVITDPLTSYFHKFENRVKRLALMDKHFPLPHNTSSIDINPAEGNLDIAFKTVHKFFTNRDTVIVLGTYAYDHLVQASGVQDRVVSSKATLSQSRSKDKNKSKKETEIKMIPVNYYEAVSTSYKKDSRELIFKLKDKFIDDGKLITYEESYPFFQYLGYSVTIKYEDDVICKLYHYNNRCTPYYEVEAYYFGDKTYEMLGSKKDKILIGSFPMIMLYNLITILKARVGTDGQSDNHTKNMYYTMNSHLIEMKNWYLDATNQTIYDNTLFQSFVVNCKGEMISSKMEKKIRIKKRLESGKKFGYAYYPDKDRNRNNRPIRFKNTSGNPIRNEKNYHIDFNSNEIEKNLEEQIESEVVELDSVDSIDSDEVKSNSE